MGGALGAIVLGSASLWLGGRLDLSDLDAAMARRRLGFGRGAG